MKEREEKQVVVTLWFIQITHRTAQWPGELSAGEGIPSPLESFAGWQRSARGERLGTKVWDDLRGQRHWCVMADNSSSHSLSKYTSSAHQPQG